MPQIVSAQYDSHDSAMQAVCALYSAGLSPQDIAVVSLRLQPTPAPENHALSRMSGPDAGSFDAQRWWEGFLEALLSRCLTPKTLRTYTAVIRSGSDLMLVHGAAEQMKTARWVLEQSGGRDIQVRVSADVDCYGAPAPYPAPTAK
ncbi:hypothetical protein GCM10022631_07480 [Deinococcus rubellus]|uniref:hypothetical protein n=1 Tax=Deinococcus rubellus TaxID=1889240 RepID=UPI0031EE051F